MQVKSRVKVKVIALEITCDGKFEGKTGGNYPGR